MTWLNHKNRVPLSPGAFTALLFLTLEIGGSKFLKEYMQEFTKKGTEKDYTLLWYEDTTFSSWLSYCPLCHGRKPR